MHPPRASRLTLACVLALALLASCSQGDSFGQTATATANGSPASFGEQDRLAARKLSIGSSTAFAAAAEPYEQALLCRSAIAAIGDRFRQSGTLGETQVRAIEQAEALYDRQLQTLGSRQGKSQGAVQRDLEQARQDGPEIGEQARLAITCLQRLQ